MGKERRKMNFRINIRYRIIIFGGFFHNYFISKSGAQQVVTDMIIYRSFGVRYLTSTKRIQLKFFKHCLDLDRSEEIWICPEVDIALLNNCHLQTVEYQGL